MESSKNIMYGQINVVYPFQKQWLENSTLIKPDWFSFKVEKLIFLNSSKAESRCHREAAEITNLSTEQLNNWNLDFSNVKMLWNNFSKGC